jgi:DNA end-binding protein Ku
VPEETHDENEHDDGPARAFWSGALSFGLVSIPVDLLPARRQSRGALRMLDADGTPLQRRYYCSADEQEVDAEHLVRGFELDSGEVVVVTDEELEALAPKKSREIDLRLFVDRDTIDPLYFVRSYFLAPGAGSGKAYRLLGSVMERSRRAGIASFVMRDKEYLVAIFAEGGLLRAETLRHVDEVRSVRQVGLPKRTKVDASAVSRLRRAVSARDAKSFDPAVLTDPHQALVQLAERKLKQKKDVVVARGADVGEPAVVTDLMEVLRQSLAQNDLASGGRRAASSTRAVKKKTRRSGASPSARERQKSRPEKASRGGAKRHGSTKKSAARRR